MRLNQPRQDCAGFTYIGLMIFVALISIGLALAGQVWHATVQREKEKELLFIGDQFRVAIGQFYEGTPGGVKKLPRSLEDLLDDKRYPTTKRHLRRIYVDPMTNGTEWGLMTVPDGSITGVYSLSDREPRKISGFREVYEQFAEAKTYLDWKFAYAVPETPENAGMPGPGTPPGSSVPQTGEKPPEPIPSPVPTIPSRDDPNRQKACDNLLITDRGRCVLAGQLHGDRVGNACDRSALMRHEACMGASRLPPLATTDGQER